MLLNPMTGKERADMNVEAIVVVIIIVVIVIIMIKIIRFKFYPINPKPQANFRRPVTRLRSPTQTYERVE